MMITQQQMSRMQDARIRTFHDRLRQHLEAEFPQECAELGKATIKRNVVESIARASELGIESERGIVKFVETAYRLHFHLDRPDLRTWSQRVLASTDLDPVAKIDHVYDTVRQAWADARRVPQGA